MKEKSILPAARTLRTITRSWFIVVFLGQLIFVLYILLLYWKSAALGDLEKWNKVMPNFYIKGDLTGNIIFGLHVAMAAVITILGPLQLIPQLRKHAPRFHRISGRVYIFSAFLISLAGLYLTWVKGSVGGPSMAVIISMNALIILVAALFTIKHAIKRDLALHQQWAVHLFLAMSGVWLFRVFLMLWLLIHQAPVGFDPDTFRGPFLDALSVFVYVFPQVIVACYFYAKRSAASSVKWAFSIFLLLITIGIALGTFAATMGMWLPRI